MSAAEDLAAVIAPWDSDEEAVRIGEIHGLRCDAETIAAARELLKFHHVSMRELEGA